MQALAESVNPKVVRDLFDWKMAEESKASKAPEATSCGPTEDTGPQGAGESGGLPGDRKTSGGWEDISSVLEGGG